MLRLSSGLLSSVAPISTPQTLPTRRPFTMPATLPRKKPSHIWFVPARTGGLLQEESVRGVRVKRARERERERRKSASKKEMGERAREAGKRDKGVGNGDRDVSRHALLKLHMFSPNAQTTRMFLPTQLAHGADATIATEHGFVPLHMAASRGLPDVRQDCKKKKEEAKRAPEDAVHFFFSFFRLSRPFWSCIPTSSTLLYVQTSVDPCACYY